MLNNNFFEIEVLLSKKQKREKLKCYFNSSYATQNEYLKNSLVIYRELMQKHESMDKTTLFMVAFYLSLQNEDVCTNFENSNINLKFDTLKLSNFFIRQSIFVQYQIIREQKNQFFQLKHLEHALILSFYKAIDIFYHQFKAKNLKNKTNSLISMPDIININILKEKKEKIFPKKERLLNYISVVKRLKTEGYSYRQMSIHLKKFYNFQVSHTYIQRFHTKYCK